jgi:hypothetical protein
MAYSNSAPYYPYHTIVPTFYPFDTPTIPPTYSTSTPISTPSPRFCFTHDYTPPAPAPSSSPTQHNIPLSNPYASYGAFHESIGYECYQHQLHNSSIPSFYHQQPPHTSTPMYHHVGLPSHQNQNPTPTLVPPQTIPPSIPTHNYQQQPQYSYSQPVEAIQNTENSHKGMDEFFEASKKMRASCVALRASFQHLIDLLKKRR